MKSAKAAKRRREATYESEDVSRLETLPKQAAKAFKQEAANTGEDFVSQLLGFTGDHANDHEGKGKAGSANDHESPKAKSHESFDNKKGLTTGVVYELFTSITGVQTEAPKKAKAESHASAAIEYHSEMKHSSESLSRTEAREHNQKIQQILNEIKKLVNTTKELQTQFGHVTVDAAPATPGKYHENLFEWMILMIRQARQKVEDSRSWLGTVQGKNSKKQSYWGKAKSQGTSFTQNNERSVATSTG